MDDNSKHHHAWRHVGADSGKDGVKYMKLLPKNSGIKQRGYKGVRRVPL